MKKRLIDIYPPHTRKATPVNSAQPFADGEVLPDGKKPKFSNLAVFAVFSLFLFAIPPLALHFYFAEATIQVWPQLTVLHVEEHIRAKPEYSALRLDERAIRSQVFEGEKVLTQLFPAHGKKLKDEKARGTIRVYNTNSAQSQSLVANTRLISEDGKIFRLERAALISPSAFLDVQVIAAEPGEEYNVGPSNFSLPGLVGSPLYTKVYGESLRAMTGGAQKEVTVVTQEDIAAARDQLGETLRIQSEKELLSRVPPQFQVLPDSLTSLVVEDNSLVKPGAELEQFNYTVKVKSSIIGFHKEDADFLAHYLLGNYVDESQEIDRASVNIAYKAAQSPVKGGAIPITVQIEANRYEKVDTKVLAELLAGLSRSELDRLFEDYPFFAKAQFSLWPFWIHRIPRVSERVHVELFLEG